MQFKFTKFTKCTKCIALPWLYLGAHRKVVIVISQEEMSPYISKVWLPWWGSCPSLKTGGLLSLRLEPRSDLSPPGANLRPLMSTTSGYRKRSFPSHLLFYVLELPAYEAFFPEIRKGFPSTIYDRETYDYHNCKPEEITKFLRAHIFFKNGY